MRSADKQLIASATLVFVYLLFGTWFFSWQEGWRPFDAFYFSGMTLTTVGYGDFTPHTDLSKIVAVFFAFSGISIIFYSLSIFAREYFEHQRERFEHLAHIPGRIMRKSGFHNGFHNGFHGGFHDVLPVVVPTIPKLRQRTLTSFTRPKKAKK